MIFFCIEICVAEAQALFKAILAIGHCLGLDNSFFCRMTKLGDRHLISSSSVVFKVTMTTLNIVSVIEKFSELK
jgi:hypothetical protein